MKFRKLRLIFIKRNTVQTEKCNKVYTIGFAKGEASGLAKGKDEAKKELIIAWRKKGKSDLEIAELLDMDEDEVRQVE